MRVGVEVGGTFTDLVAIDQGRVRIAKVPSTPARPDEGALAAIESAGLPLELVTDLVRTAPPWRPTRSSSGREPRSRSS
jgi:N-methylhydantoinase A